MDLVRPCQEGRAALTLSLQRGEVGVLESLKGMLMCSKTFKVGIKKFLGKGIGSAAPG